MRQKSYFNILQSLLLFLVLCLCPGFGVGQEHNIKFENISVQDGLSNNFVNCIIQDSRGFIWIGTKDGLNRYDGYRFVNYVFQYNDPTSISNNFISSLCEDPSHTGIWVGTSRGLNFYNFKTEKFTHFFHDVNNVNSLCDNRVTTLAVSNEGSIWVGTRKGLDRYDIKWDAVTEKIRLKESFFNHFTAEAGHLLSLSDENIVSIYPDQDGSLWIGYVDGALDQLIWHDNTVRLITYPEYKGGPITCMTEDHFGDIWITSHGSGLVKFDKKHKTFVSKIKHSSKNQVWINSLLFTENGSLWLGQYSDGLMEVSNIDSRECFNSDTHGIREFKNDPLDGRSVIADWFRCLYMDRSGVLWAGTRRNGIVKVSFLPTYFTFHGVDFFNKIAFKFKDVNAIIEGSTGIIWIGTDAGLISFDRESQSITSYGNTGKALASPSHVFCMCEDKHGRLWLGTIGDGVYRFDPKTKKFSHFQNIKGVSRKYDRITSITSLKSGELLLGFEYGGVGLLDTDELEKEQPTLSQFLKGILPSANKFIDRAKIVFQDSRGIVWITSVLDGIFKYNPFDKTLKHFVHDENDPNTISANHIASICEGVDGIIWLATDKGLDRFDVESENTTSYYVENGLPDNTVIGVCCDDQGSVWALTRKWISHLNPITGEIRNYNYYHKVVPGMFSSQRVCKTKDGRIFVGTQCKGFFSFSPSSVKSFSYKPPIVLTDLKIFGESTIIGGDGGHVALNQSVNHMSEIVLKHFQNSLAFEFSALSYCQQDKNQYACKLDGAQDYWENLGNRRVINYFNLNPGSYVLRVRASNCDGIWNNNEKTIQIKILSPWWRTWWACVLYLFVFLVLLFACFRYTIIWQNLKNSLKYEQMEKAKIEELNQLKLKFFTNISHEFRTPLTLILGPLENLMASVKVDTLAHRQYDLMSRNAKRLLRMINLLMDFRKVDNQEMKINMQNDDIVAFVGGTMELFEEFAKQKQINLEYDSQVSSLYMSFDRDKMDKILFNLLSNAFKHTNAGGSIKIGLQTPDSQRSDGDGQEVEIVVEDSGAGITEENLKRIFDRFYQVDNDGTGTGIGLSIVKSFVEMHGGAISVSSELGKGTRFVITLPFNREMYNHSLATDLTRRSEVSLSSSEHSEMITATPLVELDKSTTPDKKPLILVVEDDNDLRGFICDSLSSCFTLVEADNGVDALDVAIKQQPALIISDVMMPRMDGLELCRQIKSNPKVSHIPYILLTALSSVEDEFIGYKSGAQEYISKPFNPQTLLLRVQNFVALQNRVKERFAHDVDFGVKEITISSSDEKLLEKVMYVIEENLKNPDFTVEKMGQEIGISRVHLNRKIKALTNQTAVNFIRTIRMKHAAKLLIQKKLNVSEIAYMVGFSNPISFGRSFKKHFGVSPSEYASESSID